MKYLYGAILAYTLVMAAIWFFVGWFTKGIERGKQLKQRETDWHHQLNRLRRDRDAFRDQVEVAHGKIRVLEHRRADGSSPPRPTESDASSRARIQQLQGQLDQARQQIAGFAKKIDALDEKSIEREDVLNKLQKRLTETSRTLHDREQKLAALSHRTPQNTAQQPAAEDNEQDDTIQRLRIQAQVQADAAEQDRQRLDHTISEHMQTITALRAELSKQPTGDDSHGDSDEVLALKNELDELKKENHEQYERIEQLSSGSKVVEHQRDRLKTLQAELDEHKRRVQELETTVERNEARSEVVNALKQQIEDKEAANRKLTRSHATLEEQLDQAKEELSALRQASGNNESDTSAHQLEQRIVAYKQTIEQLERGARERDKRHADELAQLRDTMAAQEAIVTSLRDVLDRPTTPPPPSELRSSPVRRTDAGPQSGDLFDALDSESPEHTPTITLYTEPPPTSDDLKRINGIGPAFERALNGLGLYTFEQVAALGDSDIEWVAHELRSFPDRIVNGQWVEQARKLLSE